MSPGTTSPSALFPGTPQSPLVSLDDSEPTVKHSASLPEVLLHKDEAIQELEREIDNLIMYLQPVPRSEAHRNKVLISLQACAQA